MSDTPRQIVAVIGGAIAGSAIAELLAADDREVLVFEQNDRPYGKIEDGLPRWHVDQRRQEYARIDARLDRPGVCFIPRTKLGPDLDFRELVEEWGLTAVVLANGAWRDRPLAVPGAEGCEGRGLWYQNPFIYWFNHHLEAGYRGPALSVPDGALVVGGGLASIDVVKACQFELYGAALAARGIKVPVHELETRGIAESCRAHGLEPEELGIGGALLLYRRNAVDMPLAAAPADATAGQLEKVRIVRQKILHRAVDKYRFRVEERTLPTALELEDGRVRGLRVERTHLEDGRVVADPATSTVIPTELVVSSIGSLPGVIPGIDMTRETYAFTDTALGIYAGDRGVFAVGNVVTGQGNIRASLVHARQVGEHLLQSFLPGRPALDAGAVQAVHARVAALHGRAGYDGDYAGWIRRTMPEDLE